MLKTYDINLVTTMTKLMARENLSVVFQDTRTAYCNPRKREITFPTRFIGLDRDVMSVFSAHETSHALYSPIEFKKEFDKYGPHVVMVLEDIRIENKIKDDYVGLNSIFHRGYRKLHEEYDFFGIEKHGIDDVNELPFIDRFNLKAKLRDLIDVVFSDEEQDFFDRADHTKTWDDVITLCEEYVEKFKENDSSTDNDNSSNDEYTDEQPSYDPLNYSPNEDDAEEKDLDLDDEPSSSATETPPNSENGDTDDADAADGDEVDGDSDTNGSSLQKEEEGENDDENRMTPNKPQKHPAGITNQSSEEWQENFEDDEDSDANNDYAYRAYRQKTDEIYRVLDFKNEVEKFVIPWNVISESRELLDSSEMDKYANSPAYKKLKKNVQGIAKVMANEFESKKSAIRYSRSKIAKTGVIDPNKLFKHQYEDDIFLKTTQLPDEKNHGMILMVDISGSMHVNMNSVLIQILIMVEYCRMVGIPYEVYAFSNASYTEFFDWNSPEGQKILSEGVGMARFYLNWFSSRMKKAEYVKAFKEIAYLSKAGFGNTGSQYDRYCGTPLNEARIDSIPLTDEFIKKTKVEKFSLVYLTDGDGQMVNTGKYIRWKNRIFYHHQGDNPHNVFRYSHMVHEQINDIYKNLFPDFNVINLFINNGMNYPTGEYRKNGFVVVDGNKAKNGNNTSGVYMNVGACFSAFDITYIIDSKILRSIKSSMGKKLRRDPNMVYDDTDEALNHLEESFTDLSLYKKRATMVAKKIMEILA